MERGDLTALWNEIDRLHAEDRRLRERIARSWEAALWPNAWTAACSVFLALPGLRGFWPLSSRDQSGNAYDLSEQGRTLTDEGNPISNYYNLAPYVEFIFEQKLFHDDSPGFDILGTETYIDSSIRGLTMGGWFYSTSESENYLMEKFQTSGNQRSYSLTSSKFVISSDGTAETTVSLTMPTSTWCLVIARFTPSTELAAWVSGTKTTNTTSIPASICNSTAEFHIGIITADTMRASLCFLCAAALSDQIITTLLARTQDLFK